MGEDTKADEQKIYHYMHFDGKCAQALDVYKDVIGVEVTGTWKSDDDRVVLHAAFKMPGSSSMVLCDDDPFVMSGHRTPQASELYVYVDNVDNVYKKAKMAGFQALPDPLNSEGTPTDMFWGDRTVSLKDPFGHKWTIAERMSNAKEFEKSAESAAQKKAWEDLYPTP